MDTAVLVNIENFIQPQKPLVAHQMYVTEIPDMIVIETRFITRQMAEAEEILLPQTLILSSENINIQEKPQNGVFHIFHKTKDAGVMVEVDIAHKSIQTDSRNPLRNREQQTIKFFNQQDIGIQCDIENDINSEIMPMDSNPLEECETDEYHLFLDFVEKNTYLYRNNKKECIVCGEICSNSKQTLSHMATHWGPPALCELCGQKFEHANLLIIHKCTNKATKIKMKRLFKQCPLYSCGVIVKSKIDLYDHIKEHFGLLTYRCLGCKQKFRKRKELLHHSTVQKTCLPKFWRLPLFQKKLSQTKNGKLRRKHILSIRNKQHLRLYFRKKLRCHICLLKCLNVSIFAKHRKRCVKKFSERLEKLK
ncbi:zinc finger protein 354A [Bactrocera neohumeralis]|uniref:zinc finger protein 354A n=1 Tax=Bactrocera neohumeralis TaxID=98809 RepID=UPI002165A573|nr:zinc finger protein 354A [Bactrocera neohumeralis]